MQWEEVPEEDVKKLKYASRHSGKDSIYADLLEAVKAGKPIKLTLDPGVTAKAMSQRLYTAAKAQDMRVTVRTLDSKDAVVITLDTSPVKPEPVIEPAAPPADDATTNKRSKDQTPAAT